MDLKFWLKKTTAEAAKKETRTPEEIEKVNRQIEIDEFNKVYGTFVPEEDESYKKIPRFFSKPPEDDLAERLKDEAKSLCMARRNTKHLSHAELNELCNVFEDNGLPLGEELAINYKEFKIIGRQVASNIAEYFTPVVYAKLQCGDPLGRISSTSVFNYIMRKSWIVQTRIGLALYDSADCGYLSDRELERYIENLIPEFPQVHTLEQSFQDFYICTVFRKFIFFLDPLKTGRIRIQDILASGFLDALLDLRDSDMYKGISINHSNENSFSGAETLKIYGAYLHLDKDHNGLISRKELAGYGTGSLTRVFIDRVFEENITYSGELDYKTYIDFMFAMEHRTEPQSLHYLFRILDIEKKGYLDHFSISYFYRGIQEQMREIGQEPVSYDDIRNEIFDMVKPVEPTKITLRDLLNCGQGDVMISILIDIHGFWSYENREALAIARNDPEEFHIAESPF